MGEKFGYISLIAFWMCFEYVHLQDWGLSWPWLTLGNAFATKTEWVQKSSQSHELGIHRADVMKQRLDQLLTENQQLRAALEQPQVEQEPVAWATRMGEYAHIHWGAKRPEYPMVYEVPLYTSPPASKPWVGLTDEEMKACTQSPFVVENYRAVEAKLKEKNNG